MEDDLWIECLSTFERKCDWDWDCDLLYKDLFRLWSPTKNTFKSIVPENFTYITETEPTENH